MPDEHAGVPHNTESFIENTPCGFLSFTDNGDIILINQYLLDLLGVERETVVRKHVDKLFSPAGRIFYQTHFFPLLKLRSKVEEIYLSMRSASGKEIPMLVNGSRYLEDGQYVNYCVILPMRERHKLETELLAARKLAEDAMRAKDEFLAVASHELRTPLSAMLGWLHLLKETRNDPEMLQEALEVIERNASIQAQLVSDILDISRISTGKLQITVQKMNLLGVLKDTIATIHPAAEAKHITLVEKLDINTGAVSADPARLQQIFSNLLTNAVKFTPKHGTIEVQLHRVNSSVAVLVKDSGEGIPAEFLPYVFDRFKQADQTKSRKHGGLGLGLAIVKDLVELHGGTIEARSEGAGKGATFEVRFPVLSIELDPVPPVEAKRTASSEPGFVATPPSRLDGTRILVVDDSGDSLQVISRILEQYGAQVTTSNSARFALETMQHNRPDVLISDIEMPDQDGFWLIHQVRESSSLSDLPAIALTARSSGSDEATTLAAGYHLHLNKPIKPPILIESILGVTRKG